MVHNSRPAIILMLGFVFLILLILVSNGKTDLFDAAIRSLVIKSNTLIAVTVWKNISLMGSVIVMSVLTVLTVTLAALRADWYAVKLMSFSMAGAVLLETTLKWLVHRPRAEETYANTMPSSFSFPSGHALYSFTFYVTLILLLSRQKSSFAVTALWSLAAIVVVSIGASRIFLGVHYVSDVLGGYLIAATWVMFCLTRVDPAD